MLNKTSNFNLCDINPTFSVTELTTILLAYIPTGFITWLIAPFSCIIRRTSLQSTTIILLEKGEEYEHTLILEVIKQSTLTLWSFILFFFFEFWHCGFFITALETPSFFPFLSFLASSVVASSTLVLSCKSFQPACSYNHFQEDIFERCCYFQ